MSGVSRGEGQARAVRSFQFSFGILSAVFVFFCCTTCVFKYRHCLSSSQRAWFNQHCHQYPLPAYLESWTSTVTASWTRSSSSEDASMTPSWSVFSMDPKYYIFTLIRYFFMMMLEKILLNNVQHCWFFTSPWNISMVDFVNKTITIALWEHFRV